jgi:hypothetical protein
LGSAVEIEYKTERELEVCEVLALGIQSLEVWVVFGTILLEFASLPARPSIPSLEGKLQIAFHPSSKFEALITLCMDKHKQDVYFEHLHIE